MQRGKKNQLAGVDGLHPTLTGLPLMPLFKLCVVIVTPVPQSNTHTSLTTGCGDTVSCFASTCSKALTASMTLCMCVLAMVEGDGQIQDTNTDPHIINLASQMVSTVYFVATSDSSQAAWSMCSGGLVHVSRIGPYGVFPSGRDFQPGWTLPRRPW